MNVAHTLVVVQHSVQHRFRALASSVLGTQPPDRGGNPPQAYLAVVGRREDAVVGRDDVVN